MDVKFILEWRVWYVDRVVTATSKQGALCDYHTGPLELWKDGLTGGIWFGWGHKPRPAEEWARRAGREWASNDDPCS